MISPEIIHPRKFLFFSIMCDIHYRPHCILICLPFYKRFDHIIISAALDNWQLPIVESINDLYIKLCTSFHTGKIHTYNNKTHTFFRLIKSLPIIKRKRDCK